MLMAGLGLVVGLLRPLRPRWSLIGHRGESRSAWWPRCRARSARPSASASSGTSRSSPISAGSWTATSRSARSWRPRPARDGPRTVLAPTPEATLVWYYAGQKVVYLHPTAAIKLAYDVQRMTGFGEAERAADLVTGVRRRPDRACRDRREVRRALRRAQAARRPARRASTCRPTAWFRRAPAAGTGRARRDQPLRVPGRLAE